MTAMTIQARRLREAVERARPRFPLSRGDSEEDIRRLQAAFAPRHLPQELLDLLAVLGGGSHHWLLIHDAGPNLSSQQITEETSSRAHIARGGAAAARGEDIGWCPAWVVLTSEQHSFSAVVASDEPRDRSLVLELSYGNFGYPVVAGSLTALVAASADAWEQGLHDYQLDPAYEELEDYTAYRTDVDYSDAYEDRMRLIAARDAEYPSADGFAAQDCIGGFEIDWPDIWPRDTHEVHDPYLPPTPLAHVDSRSRTVAVTVREQHGPWHLVQDETGEAWLNVPPGFVRRRRIEAGQRWRFSVATQRYTIPIGVPPRTPPERTLLATGVLGQL